MISKKIRLRTLDCIQAIQILRSSVYKIGDDEDLFDDAKWDNSPKDRFIIASRAILSFIIAKNILDVQVYTVEQRDGNIIPYLDEIQTQYISQVNNQLSLYKSL